MSDAEMKSLPRAAPEGPALASLILKGSSTSTTDRDAGFCSGGDEDDLEVEDDIHSPTDASEDSVEVKVTPISLRNKNKRKCAEPRKVPNEDLPSGPLKKRIRFDPSKESTEGENQSPFRPWSVPARPVPLHPSQEMKPSTSPPLMSFHPVYGYQLPLHQEEPLSLVTSREETTSSRQRRDRKIEATAVPEAIIRPKEFAKLPVKMSHESHPPRVPLHPAVRLPTPQEMEELTINTTSLPKTSPGFTVENLLSSTSKTSCSSSTSVSKQERTAAQQKEQRNYKNMTRERRIEANARERTRVHTISAAFDTLRRAIPAYSHNQKLSKLSVLRIACSYILTLSRVAGEDYSADQSAPSLASCVDLVSRTIQTEGKLRKKKDE